MTEAEAIKILEKEKAYMDSHGGDTQSTALGMAINALEKQIAKKPIIRGLGQRYCSVCGCGGADHQYCGRCGQKLDSEV